MNDGLSDLTSRIRNAYAAKQLAVRMPHTQLKHAVVQVLVAEGYVEKVSVEGTAPFQELVIELKYHNAKEPVISGIERLSKPGRRLYSPSKAVPRTLGGYGITILSTNKGILSDKQARSQNVGGELLCKVW